MAALFHISVDTLLGVETPTKETVEHQDISASLLQAISVLSDEDINATALRTAFMLHAATVSRHMEKGGNPGWYTEHAIYHAGEGEWGLSAIYGPSFISKMRGQTVLFSGTRSLPTEYRHLREIAAVCKVFSDVNTIKVAATIFTLTAHDEEYFTDIPAIALQSSLAASVVQDCVDGQLGTYLDVMQDKTTHRYRITGSMMFLLPLLTLLSNT